uniref:FERM domain containing 8 n=1 Tax=Nomascus leucogenys TaxID=61853 RepID=A0A2I3H1S6_NOMLE
YLADDTVVPLAVENLPSLSAHELHRAVREVLQLPDIALDVFALWLVSPLLDEPFLQFRRNVFFPKRRELQGAASQSLACTWRACQVLGPGEPTRDREKLDSFLPAHLCKRSQGLFAALRGRGARAGLGEQGLLNAYRQVQEVSSDSGCEAALGTHYHAYLLKCHELPFYGCAFFHGEVDKPAQGFLHRGGRKPVSVAISLEGVHVIDSREKHVLLGLRFQELSWDHTSPEEEEPILWLEFDGDSEGTPVNKLLKIYSKQVVQSAYLSHVSIVFSRRPSMPGSHQDPTLHLVVESPQASLAPLLSVPSHSLAGKGIRRVKPKRTTSFFSRQLSLGQGSYTVVQSGDSLEQG